MDKEPAHRPATVSQLKAAKENWAIFLLKGMLSQSHFLIAVIGRKEFGVLQASIEGTIQSIKTKQVERKERKKK